MNHSEIEILLIDDNDNDAEMAIRSLRKNNVTNNILHLSDGATAIEYIYGTGRFEGRNINIKPKVILLDLKMPRVDGIEVLKKIKSGEDTSTIPVVILTSSKEDPDIKTCYSLGANSYIVKPVNFDAFHKVVGELGLYWVLTNQRSV